MTGRKREEAEKARPYNPWHDDELVFYQETDGTLGVMREDKYLEQLRRGEFERAPSEVNTSPSLGPAKQLPPNRPPCCMRCGQKMAQCRMCKEWYQSCPGCEGHACKEEQ
jgi:hypothetical protein